MTVRDGGRRRARRPGSRRRTFLVLAVAVSCFSMLQSLIVPVLPRIQEELGTDQATVTWVLTAYLLSASVCTPIVGRLGDQFGKVRLLATVLVALAVGSAVAAFTTDIWWLVAGRVVQGMGGAVVPLAYSIIREEFHEGMGRALSLVASLTAAGFGAGIVLAGPIYDGLGYRWLFLLPLIVAVLAAIGALVVVPESTIRQVGSPPVLPAVLLAISLVGFLLAITKVQRWGTSDPRTVATLGVGLLSGVAWLLAERRVRVPFIDLEVMRLRGVWTSNVVVAFLGFGMFAAFGFLPQLLQTPAEAGYGFGATVTESGHLLLPWAAATFVTGLFSASLVDRFGSRSVITAGSLLTAVAFAALAAWHDTVWQICAWTLLQGIGSGLVTAAMAGVVVAAVPLDKTGVASGMNANIRTIGGAVGAAVMGAIVTADAGPSGLPSEAGYTVGFAALAVSMIFATLAAAFIPGGDRLRGRPVGIGDQVAASPFDQSGGPTRSEAF